MYALKLMSYMNFNERLYDTNTSYCALEGSTYFHRKQLNCGTKILSTSFMLVHFKLMCCNKSHITSIKWASNNPSVGWCIRMSEVYSTQLVCVGAQEVIIISIFLYVKCTYILVYLYILHMSICVHN